MPSLPNLQTMHRLLRDELAYKAPHLGPTAREELLRMLEIIEGMLEYLRERWSI